MPKKKEPQLSPSEQRKRFEELAREAGSDTQLEQLKRVIKDVARAPSPSARKPPRGGK